MTPLFDWDAVIAELRKGWRKGDYGLWDKDEGDVGLWDKDEGDVDLLGAMYRVRRKERGDDGEDRLTAAVQPLGDAILHLYDDRYGSGIGHFNDHPLTTLEDVIKVVEWARDHPFGIGDRLNQPEPEKPSQALLEELWQEAIAHDDRHMQEQDRLHAWAERLREEGHEADAQEVEAYANNLPVSTWRFMKNLGKMF